ncbi:hypothetical protein LB941_00155 [Ligilactobacillus sp. WILCCON 0076]|uniref:Uncharacterized protein n=1 Tax=Ligilactobacillus ubinensis TaxID=2876789 RepID=A0A9X2FFR5_9LACO|nr:hypothetical protein [Ligilactobacillus ubinensis]MCP0885742.1 hypothetical protein [Ligilactobacillus ubinensis]
MNKNEILKAAQQSKDDKGKWNHILTNQSIMSGFYSLGLLFILIIRLLLIFLVLLDGLGIEILEVINKRSIISILMSSLLIVAVAYTAWTIAIEK